MVGGRVVGDICGHDNEHVILYTFNCSKGFEINRYFIHALGSKYVSITFMNTVDIVSHRGHVTEYRGDRMHRLSAEVYTYADFGMVIEVLARPHTHTHTHTHTERERKLLFDYCSMQINCFQSEKQFTG